MTRFAVYRAEAAGTCIRRPMGVMTLIYHRRSGITHMLADPAPQILDALAVMGAADAAAVGAWLAERFDLAPETEEAAMVVAARLEELRALGLVARDGP